MTTPVAATTPRMPWRGNTAVASVVLTLPFVIGSSAAVAQLPPLEIEARVIRVLSMRPYETADGWKWGAMHFPFLWSFSQPPVVILNVQHDGPPNEAFPAAPLNVSAGGFDLTLADNAGTFFRDTLPPPLEAGHLHRGVMEVIAVVPQAGRSIVGNVDSLEDGAYVAFPEWFVIRAQNRAIDRIDPVVLVNAQRDGRPLRAAAVYDEMQYFPDTQEFVAPRGFTLRLSGIQGEAVAGPAEVNWLAVLPGANNPFRGGQFRGFPAESIEVLPRLRTGTFPRFVTNARQGDTPLVSAADVGDTFRRSFALTARDASGDAFPTGPGIYLSGLERVKAPWLAVEPFYNTHRNTGCRIDVVSERNRIEGDPWFFAEARALVTEQVGSSEVSRGRGGYYTLVEIYGPPDQRTCNVDISYDLRVVGVINRFATAATPIGAALGTYKAEVVTGIVPEEETGYRLGVSTTVWKGAIEELAKEFLYDVGEIVVGEALTGGLGKPVGRTLDVVMFLAESSDNALTCDEQVHREGPVHFTDLDLRVGRRYKVFVYVDGQAVQAALGLYAEGYTEIDFVGRGPAQCERGSELYLRKDLRISNVTLTDRDTTHVAQDRPAPTTESAGAGADSLQEQPNGAYMPWDSLVAAYRARWREPTVEPTPPPSLAPSVLRVQALNDRPGPVTVVVLGFGRNGERIVERALQWDGDDNTFSTESTDLPAGVVAVSLVFMNDVYRPGGPDDDRNGFIDYLEWEGVRLEAEDFDGTGGLGDDPGCGRRPEPQASGGYVAGCGNGGDWVTFYRPGLPR